MASTIKSPDEIKSVPNLFKDVSFYLIDESKEEIKQLLKQGGAQREFYVSDLVTHVIADSVHSPQYEQAKDAKLNVVTSNWVTMCVKCETILPPEPFSVEKSKLFSGLVVCPSQIPSDDRDALWAMVTYYGGQCQSNLNPTCTHLVTGKPSGRKFECALQHSEKIKVVTPEWITESINSQKLLPEDEYFPLVDSPASPPVSTFSSVKQGSQTPSRLSTPKMNEGTPSTLLTPVTPTVTLPTTREMTPSSMFPTTPSSEPDEIQMKIRNGHHGQAVLKNGDNGSNAGAPVQIIKKEKIEEEPKPVNTVDQSTSDLLKGLVFVFADYKEKMPQDTFNIWLDVIRRNAGEIDDNFSKRCTHFLCLHQQGDDYKKAFKDGTKIATAHWLNDVLVKKRMFPPSNALHFPVPFSDSVPGCKSMLMTVSGYEGAERTLVKNMIFILGAQYSGYMCRRHTHLISKSPIGEKYRKAKEWGINVVNAKWLSDMLQAGQTFPCNASARYTKLGEEDDLNLNEEFAKELLVAWKTESMQNEEDIQEKENTKPKKRKSIENPQDTQEKYAEPVSKQRKADSPKESRTRPCVLFTGLTGPAVHKLSQMLKKMKGEIAKGVRNCTHLIAPKITRTVKFLSAISVVEHIVLPGWIEESFKENCFVDETQYALKDPESEELFGFKLDTSLKRAKTRKVFLGLKFYSTPRIIPAPGHMKEIIECAGGEMVELNADEKKLMEFVEQKKKRENCYLITCEDDRPIWENLRTEGHDVYSVELVLSGVMKQELEWDLYRVVFDILFENQNAICRLAMKY